MTDVLAKKQAAGIGAVARKLCGRPCAIRFGIASALALSAALPAFAQDAPVTIAEVFVRGAAGNTSPAPPPSCQPPACEIRIYRMDGMQDIEERINAEMAAAINVADENAARAWATANQERIKKAYSKQIMEAANGVTLAMHYRLKRVPAVVLNRAVAVYDTADVARAIEHAQTKGLLK